ncbi:MAG: divalent-cation tolerance protein CutA [Gemmatimonas sp.]
MANVKTSTRTVLVYVTAPSARAAERIGATVVEEGLAACANVLGPVRSVFRWQGKVERAREAVLILKTRASGVPALTRRVKALHSYTVPCVVALPILGGNADFISWIVDESAPRAAKRPTRGKASGR